MGLLDFAAGPFGIGGQSGGFLESAGEAANPIGWFTGGAQKEMASAYGAGMRASQAAAARTQAMALDYAKPTHEELQMLQMQVDQLNRTNAFQMQELARAEQMLNVINPNIMEASKQALAMMRGENTKFMRPIQEERARQRQQLQQQLQNTLGSGYAGTSAGQVALNNFDRQTQQLTTQAQFQGMGQMEGMAQGFAGIGSGVSGTAWAGATNQSNMMSQNLASRNAIQQRQVNALTGTAQNVIGYASAPYAQSYMSAQQRVQNFNQMLGLGIRGASAYATGGGSELFSSTNSGSGGGGYAAPSGGGYQNNLYTIPESSVPQDQVNNPRAFGIG